MLTLHRALLPFARNVRKVPIHHLRRRRRIVFVEDFSHSGIVVLWQSVILDLPYAQTTTPQADRAPFCRTKTRLCDKLRYTGLHRFPVRLLPKPLYLT